MTAKMFNFNLLVFGILIVLVILSDKVQAEESKNLKVSVVGHTGSFDPGYGGPYGYPDDDGYNPRRRRRRRRRNTGGGGCGRVGQLRKNLRVAKKRLNRLLSTRSSLQSALAKVERRSTNVAKRLRISQSRKDALVSQKSALQHSLASLKSELGAKRGAVVQKKREIFTLQKKLRKRKRSLAAALSAKERADARVLSARHKVAFVLKKLHWYPYSGLLRRRLKKAKRSLSFAEHAALAARAKLSVESAAVAKLQAEIAAARHDVAVLQKSIVKIAAQVRATQSRIFHVQRAIVRVNRDIRGLSAALAAINAKLAKLKGQLAAVQFKISGAKSDVENAKIKLSKKIVACLHKW